MGEVIVVTSGKGGVGKTTITANIGAALAMLGKKVVLVDGDTGLRNLDILMGLENRVVYNLVDVIEGNCSLKQALIAHKKYPDLRMLPTSQMKNKNDVKPEEIITIIKTLKEEYDYVFIDSPAGIEQGFESSAIAAEKALVVVNPEVTSVRDADRVIGILDNMGIKDHKVIINRIDYEMVKNGDMLDVDDIINSLEVKIIGVIPSDKSITISINRGEPIGLDSNSKMGKIFGQIAMRIQGYEVPFEPFEESEGRFVNVVKKWFVTK